MGRLDRRLYLVVMLFVAGILSYIAFWWKASHFAAESVSQFSHESGAAAVQTKYSTLGVSGFPYRIEIDLTEVQLQSGNEPYYSRCNLPQLKLVAHPWGLNHWLSLIEKPFLCKAEFRSNALQLDAGGGRASLILGNVGRSERFSLQLRDLTMNSRQGGASGKISQLQAHLRKVPGDVMGYDLALTTEELVLANLSKMDMPIEIDAAALEARILGLVPLKWKMESIDLWRAEGGVLDIQRLWVKWAGVDAKVSGTFALDDLFRPIGAGTAIVEGYSEILSVLNGAGLIGSGTMFAAALALDLLSSVSEETGQPLVEVPISIQDGFLNVGPVALMEVQALQFFE